MAKSENITTYQIQIQSVSSSAIYIYVALLSKAVSSLGLSNRCVWYLSYRWIIIGTIHIGKNLTFEMQIFLYHPNFIQGEAIRISVYPTTIFLHVLI